MFLLITFAILIVTIVLLAGIHFTREMDTYIIRFSESVSGLEIGAQVKYNGVRIGQIVDIEIDKENTEQVISTLEVRKGTPIKSDSEAILVATILTGLKFVEVTGGTKSAKLLPPGSEIPSGQSLIGTIEGKAQDIAVKTEIAITKINTVLSEKNLKKLDEIVENVRNITEGVSEFLETNDEKLDKIVVNLQQTSIDLKDGMASANRSVQRVEKVVASADPKVDIILNNIKDATVSFKKAGKSLSKIDKILKNIGGTLDKFNNQLKDINVDKMAKDAELALEQAKEALKSIRRLVDASRSNIYQSSKSLKKTMRNLEELSGDLRDQPSLLLNAKPPKERTPKER